MIFWELAKILLHVQIYGRKFSFYIYIYIWEIKLEFNVWSNKKKIFQLH